MRIHVKMGLLASLSALAATTPADPACALSCADEVQEVLTLELDSVTEDGIELDDTSDYDSFAVHIEGSPYDGTDGFTLFAVEGESNTWREDYQ